MPGHGDEYVAKLLRNVDVPVVLVLNKIDLVKKSALLPLIAQLQRRGAEFAATSLPISAATGDGVGGASRKSSSARCRTAKRSIPTIS